MQSYRPLEGRAAIVTGGAWGIGGETARVLASRGAKVLIADVDLDGAKVNAATITKDGGSAQALRADVSKAQDIKAMVQAAIDAWARLDILVNNAFATTPGAHVPSNDLEENVWDREYSVLIRAIYLGCKYAVPYMARAGKGSIVNLSSVHGMLTSGGGWLTYDSAKHAVIGATKALALEHGPSGIRVNAVCPGFIMTERGRKHWEGREAALEFVNNYYPVRRHGWPIDIANAIAFLCSDDASFITGAVLPVDGGLTIQLQDTLAVHAAKWAREHPDVPLG